MSAEPGTRIGLAAGEVLRLESAAGLEVACEAGRVWLTEEAQAGDTWLTPGCRARLTGRGLAVLEATVPASLRLSRE